MTNWRTYGSSALVVAGLLASAPVLADNSAKAPGIDAGFLRLVPPGDSQAPDGLLPSATDALLAEQLPVSPRYEGLELSLTDLDPATGVMPGLKFGLGHQMDDIGISVFGTFGGATHRNGLVPSQSGIFGSDISDAYAITSPELGTPDQISDYRVGGQLAYSGLAFGIGFAQDQDLRNGTAFNDYRFGLSYGLDNWRVGLNYTRSLSLVDQQRTSEFADSVELGGSWKLSDSFMLRGGIQYWEQSRVGLATDSSTGVYASETTFFLGTQLRF